MDDHDDIVTHDHVAALDNGGNGPWWPGRYFSLTGATPVAFPNDWSIGFIGLTSGLEDVIAVLGAPDTSQAGGYGGEHRWSLPGGAEFEVGTLEPTGGGLMFVGLMVPEGSPVRSALSGGVVVGASNVGNLVKAWGEPTECDGRGMPGYLGYTRCVGEGDLVAPLVFYVGANEELGNDASIRFEFVSLAEDQYPGAWEACRALELQSSGLGIIDFGFPDVEGVAALRAALGPFTSDWSETWDSPIGIHNGYPAETRFRQLEWADLGVRAVFSDGVTWPDGQTDSVFVSWVYWGGASKELILTTAQGTTVGSPAEAVFDEYGEDLPIGSPDEVNGWGTALPSAFPDAAPFVSGLHFGFSADPTQPEAIVTDLGAGVAQAP